MSRTVSSTTVTLPALTKRITFTLVGAGGGPAAVDGLTVGAGGGGGCIMNYPALVLSNQLTLTYQVGAGGIVSTNGGSTTLTLGKPGFHGIWRRSWQKS